MKTTKNYTRPIMVRDGENLIERKRINRKDKERYEEACNRKGLKLIKYGCSFFIFKKYQKKHETN